MSFITVIERVSGINNKIAPNRPRQTDTGVTDIVEGVDVDVDDNGFISVRLGQEEIGSNKSHSVFCGGGDCFVAVDGVSDTSIHNIGLDFVIGPDIVFGLTLGEYISWMQVAGKTFFSNGFQKGFFEGKSYYPWPGNDFKAVDKSKVYSSAPTGKHIAYFNGRAWVAVEDGDTGVIYISLLNRLGTFELGKYFFKFGTHIRMMRPVAGGVFVSDSETTGFIAAAQKWQEHKYIRKAPVPAHEWADNQMLVDLSKTYLQIPGLCAIWSSDEGLCVGTPEGELIVTTKDKLFYPSGSSGATVCDGQNIINSVY